MRSRTQKDPGDRRVNLLSLDWEALGALIRLRSAIGVQRQAATAEAESALTEFEAEAGA